MEKQAIFENSSILKGENHWAQSTLRLLQDTSMFNQREETGSCLAF